MHPAELGVARSYQATQYYSTQSACRAWLNRMQGMAKQRGRTASLFQVKSVGTDLPKRADSDKMPQFAATSATYQVADMAAGDDKGAVKCCGGTEEQQAAEDLGGAIGGHGEGAHELPRPHACHTCRVPTQGQDDLQCQHC